MTDSPRVGSKVEDMVPGENLSQILARLEDGLLVYVKAIAAGPPANLPLARQRDAFIATIAHHCLQMGSVATQVKTL
jgi:hypothetical protein